MQKLAFAMFAGMIAVLSTVCTLPGSAQNLGPSVIDPTVSATPTVAPTKASESSGSDAQELKINVTRVAGTDRYATAIAITKHLYKDQSAEKIIIASGVQFPDAITAANFFVGDLPVPLLLTPSKTITQEVRKELLRIAKPNAQVVFIGGVNAIDLVLEKDLSNQGFSVSRIAGSERQSTSIEVANRASLRARNGFSVLTPADDFALGIFGASLAIRMGGTHVVAYEEPLQQVPIREWFAKEKSKRITVLGDRIDFSSRGSSYEVVRSNAPERVPSVVCYPKTNCTESSDILPPATAQQTIVENMLVKHFGRAQNIVFVSANKPVDGIGATQLASKLDAPILPIDSEGLHRYLGVLKHLGKVDRNFYIIGGEDAIDKKVEDQILAEMGK